jgi:hypothetical protein
MKTENLRFQVFEDYIVITEIFKNRKEYHNWLHLIEFSLIFKL